VGLDEADAPDVRLGVAALLHVDRALAVRCHLVDHVGRDITEQEISALALRDPDVAFGEAKTGRKVLELGIGRHQRIERRVELHHGLVGRRLSICGSGYGGKREAEHGQRSEALHRASPMPVLSRPTCAERSKLTPTFHLVADARQLCLDIANEPAIEPRAPYDEGALMGVNTRVSAAAIAVLLATTPSQLVAQTTTSRGVLI